MTAHRTTIDEDGRCTRSDLPPEWCAGCQDHALAGIDPLEQVGRVPDTRDAQPLLDIDVTFNARYPGRCSTCPSGIRVGDTIGQTSSGEYVCSDCAA